MSVKICLCSDNHGNINPIKEILNENPMCDYYFHLGDSSLNENDIKPFISVKGNNDMFYDYPEKRIVHINNHDILLMHGTGYTYSLSELSSKAKMENCDVVMFGHTHIFEDLTYEDIRLINPGSCFHNRDLSKPSYALVIIDDNGNITVERKEL